MPTLLWGGGMVIESNEAEYDTRIARAIDRVLQGESVAQASIAECEKQGQELLEHARHEARAVLDRAHERIVALHTKAALAPAEGAAPERVPSQSGAGAPPVDRERAAAAVQKLADILLGQVDHGT